MKIAFILVLFGFSSFVIKSDKEIKPPSVHNVNKSVTPFIGFYLNTDSIIPDSYESLNELYEAYRLIEKRDFYIKVYPIKSGPENGNNLLFKKRVTKIKRMIETANKIKINNIKLMYSPYEIQWGDFHGFVFELVNRKRTLSHNKK